MNGNLKFIILSISQDPSGAQAIGNNQARLLIGPFTVSPAFGFILPGGQQVITVECIAESSDKFDEVNYKNL